MKTFAFEIINAWGFTPALRVSVTGLCNLDCSFCHNEGNRRVPGNLSLADYKRLAEEAALVGIKNVKFTGGEPTTRRDLPAIVSVFRDAGFSECSLISNGVLLKQALQRELFDAGLHRVSVSLPTLRPALYGEMFNTDPRKLALVIENLSSMTSVFPSVKINSVFIPGKNFPEDVIPLVRFAASTGIVLSVLSVLKPNDGEKPLSLVLKEMLSEHFIVCDVDETQKRGFNASLFRLSNGALVEIDDFRWNEAVAHKNSNSYCKDCVLRSQCVEGPYAFRIKADGTFKPCLIRADNEVAFERALAA